MKLRMIKSNEEIEIIKNGARIADIGGEEIANNIREGNSELEVAIAGRDKMEREIVVPTNSVPGLIAVDLRNMHVLHSKSTFNIVDAI